MSRPCVRRVGPSLAATCAGALLTGCMNLSGLGSSPDYACKAPEGVTCQSVSGTYANALADNLPSQRGRAAAPAMPASSSPGQVMPASAETAPLRSAPRILRLWFKPWEDADRDLFDQGHVYVRIDDGRWLVEHARRTIREAHAPVRASTPRSDTEPPLSSELVRAQTGTPPRPVLPPRPAVPTGPAGNGQPRE